MTSEINSLSHTTHSGDAELDQPIGNRLAGVPANKNFAIGKDSMVNSNGQRKRKRGPAPNMFERAFRKALNQKIDTKGKDRRVNRMADNLCAIASSDQTSVGLQAAKILMSQFARQPAKYSSEGEIQSETDRLAALEQKTDEELDAEIEALDSEIKELQQALASAPTGNP